MKRSVLLLAFSAAACAGTGNGGAEADTPQQVVEQPIHDRPVRFHRIPPDVQCDGLSQARCRFPHQRRILRGRIGLL